MGDTLIDMLDNSRQWQVYSRNGVERVAKYYSWRSHVERYLEDVCPLAESNTPRRE